MLREKMSGDYILYKNWVYTLILPFPAGLWRHHGPRESEQLQNLLSYKHNGEQCVHPIYMHVQCVVCECVYLHMQMWKTLFCASKFAP